MCWGRGCCGKSHVEGQFGLIQEPYMVDRGISAGHVPGRGKESEPGYCGKAV